MGLAASRWKRAGPRTSWRRVFPSFGLVYSHILLLLIPAGVLVYAHAWGLDRVSFGFFVQLLTVDSLRNQNEPYSEVIFLSVDAKEQWMLNGVRTPVDEMSAKLTGMKGDCKNCVVFLDVNKDLPYSVAVQAVDSVQRTGFKVVLLTPGTKALCVP